MFTERTRPRRVPRKGSSRQAHAQSISCNLVRADNPVTAELVQKTSLHSLPGQGMHCQELHQIDRQTQRDRQADLQTERESLFQGSLYGCKMLSSAALESCSGKLPFFKALSPKQKASSAACDSVNGKVPFVFKALSLQCKMPVISCLRFVQRKASVFSRISLFNTKALHQLPLIQSAESFLFS